MKNKSKLDTIDLNSDPKLIIKFLRETYFDEVKFIKDPTCPDRLLRLLPQSVKNSYIKVPPNEYPIHYYLRLNFAHIFSQKITSITFEEEVRGHISVFLMLEEQAISFEKAFDVAHKAQKVLKDHLLELFNDYPLSGTEGFTDKFLESRIAQIFSCKTGAARNSYNEVLVFWLRIFLKVDPDIIFSVDPKIVAEASKQPTVENSQPKSLLLHDELDIPKYHEIFASWNYGDVPEKMGYSRSVSALIERKFEIDGRHHRVQPAGLLKFISRKWGFLVGSPMDGRTSTFFDIARMYKDQGIPDIYPVYLPALDILQSVNNNIPVDSCIEIRYTNSSALRRYRLSGESYRRRTKELILSGKMPILVDDFDRLDKSDRIRVNNYFLQCPNVIYAVSDKYFDNQIEMDELKHGRSNEPLVIRLKELSYDEKMDFIRLTYPCIKNKFSNLPLDRLIIDIDLRKFNKVDFQLRTMTDLVAAIVGSDHSSGLAPVYAILADQLKKAGLGRITIPHDKSEFSDAEKLIFELGKIVNRQTLIGSSLKEASDAIYLIDIDVLLKYISELNIRKHFTSLLFTKDERKLEFYSFSFYIFVGAVHRFYAPEEYAPNIISKTFGGFWGVLQSQISHYSKEITSLRYGFDHTDSPFSRNMVVDQDAFNNKQEELDRMMKALGETLDL